jgi:hypothetical protein
VGSAQYTNQITAATTHAQGEKSKMIQTKSKILRSRNINSACDVIAPEYSSMVFLTRTEFSTPPNCPEARFAAFLIIIEADNNPDPAVAEARMAK